MKNHMIFHWKMLTFFTFEKKIKKFQLFVFRSRKNIYFFGVEIFFEIYIDAEICPLSIYEVFRAIPTILREFWDVFLKNTVFLL